MSKSIRGDEVRRGQHIYLDAVSNDLLDTISDDVLSDTLLNHWHNGTAPLRPTTTKELVQAQKEAGEIVFAVRRIEDDTYVGIASLSDIGWKARHAEMRVGMIDDDYLTADILSDIIQTVLQFAYWEANLNHIGVNCAEDQSALIDALEQVSFLLEGRWRQHLFRNGRYLDQLTYGILAREWSR